MSTCNTWSDGVPHNIPEILNPEPWVLPPLSNSWIINIVWLYTALNRILHIDCYWVGAVPNLNLTTVSG